MRGGGGSDRGVVRGGVVKSCERCWFYKSSVLDDKFVYTEDQIR